MRPQLLILAKCFFFFEHLILKQMLSEIIGTGFQRKDFSLIFRWCSPVQSVYFNYALFWRFNKGSMAGSFKNIVSPIHHPCKAGEETGVDADPPFDINVILWQMLGLKQQGERKLNHSNTISLLDIFALQIRRWMRFDILLSALQKQFWKYLFMKIWRSVVSYRV